MAWKNEGFVLPKIAASAIAQCVCVKGDTTTDNQVFVAGANTDDVIGVTIATVPTYGLSVGVQVEGVAKVLVAASVGAGVRVSVASSNGAIGPVAAPASSGVPVGAPVYSLGVIQEARGAGEYGSVFIDPREIV
jgi:hypothetical protein